MEQTIVQTSEKEVVIVERVLGNAADAEWKERLAGAELDTVALDQWEAQKSRLRRTTAQGGEVAISLDRGVQLRDGDVLLWDADRRRALLVRVALYEVMEADLSGVAGADTTTLIETAVMLGHALGNQHWPAVVKGTKVYVPANMGEAIMSSVMRTHALKGVTYRFLSGTEAVPNMTTSEARRLFGGATREGVDHVHGGAGHHHHHH